MKRKFLVTLLSAAAIFAAGTLTACSNASEGGTHTHTWDDGEILSPASCGSPGLIAYFCTECGELKTEIIPQLEHEHSDEWLKNADEHWHPATCRHTGARVGVAPHEWGEGEVITSATCLKTGLKKYTCICGETKTEIIEKTAHSFAEDYSTDDDKHWRVCTTEGCAEISDEHAHNFSDGEITTPATCKTEGEKTFTCTDCGKTKTETVAIADHSYGENWSYDEDGHYHACTTEGCDEIKDEEEHTFGEWSTEGRIYRPCTECGYEELAPALTTTDKSNEMYEQLTNVTVTVGGGEKAAVNVFALAYYYYTVTYYGETPVKVVCKYEDNKGNKISNRYVLSPENPCFTERLPDRTIACLFIESDAQTAFGCHLSLSVSETAPKHTHNYSEEWSHDADQHWHACTGSDCDVDSDVGMHEYENGVCSVCGYDPTQAPSKTEP